MKRATFSSGRPRHSFLGQFPGGVLLDPLAAPLLGSALRVVVKDKETSLPIEGATIDVILPAFELHQRIKTKESGAVMFQFEAPPSDAVVTISASGYKRGTLATKTSFDPATEVVALSESEMTEVLKVGLGALGVLGAIWALS